MVKRTISIILILIGIAIMAYPVVDGAYSSYQQAKILEELNRVYLAFDDGEEEGESTNSAELTGVSLDEATREELPVEPLELIQVEPEPPVAAPPPPKEVKSPPRKELGVLKIEKINLTLPILEGASDSNMKVGAGQVKGTAAIGEIGNTALASHRSHSYGRLFNRLNEVDVGDEIVITTKEATHTYRVYQQLIVEPNDTSVLRRNDQDRILTLITCEPIKNPTHRLIIHALQIDNKNV